jgi:hypothetical protein
MDRRRLDDPRETISARRSVIVQNASIARLPPHENEGAPPERRQEQRGKEAGGGACSHPAAQTNGRFHFVVEITEAFADRDAYGQRLKQASRAHARVLVRKLHVRAMRQAD